MSITERLKELIATKGHGAQKELSQFIGVGQSTLNNWLQYGRSIPSEYIVGIAKFFGVSVNYLLIGADEITGEFKGYDATGKPVELSHRQQELAKLRANEALTKRVLEILEESQKKD